MTDKKVIKLAQGLIATFQCESDTMVDFCNTVIKKFEQQPKTIQEEQAESEKYEKVYDDGYKDGYVQAKFDYEPQPSDDCITKAEVINTIHKTIYGFFDIADDDSEEPINDKDKLLLTINKAISNAVKALPSVTPQPRTGHWEDCSNGWCCSNCWRDVSHESDFCPHCGADMRESEE